MLKTLFLAFVVCMASSSVMAQQTDYGQFSLDTPEGWQQMGEPTKYMESTVIVLTNAAKQTMITMSYTSPSQGEDAKMLAEVTSQVSKGIGMNIIILKADAHYAEVQGEQGPMNMHVYLLASPEDKEMMSISVSGSKETAAEVLKTLTFKNPKLALQ